MKFKSRCLGVRNKEPNAYVDLNNFIEENYDDVIRFLDTTRQTSLEIEIIICYQKIDTMVEPPEIQSQHLIIDEVQDNSVFEFVYSLKYVEKHQESLFIVGRHDCDCPRKSLLTAGKRHAESQNFARNMQSSPRQAGNDLCSILDNAKRTVKA